MQSLLTSPKPIPGVMFGITHELDGSLIIREPKILKVGIGLPKGPALTVWIAADGKWKLARGYAKDAIQTFTCDTRAQAEELYWKQLPGAPVCPYPRKAPYFLFTKSAIVNGEERFVPDFDAIEAHGSMPTEIDIIPMDDSPFTGSYQMWSSSDLRCSGDGVTASRVLSMAATPEEKALATEAAQAGLKHFPILGACWTGDCRFSKEANGKPSLCKPGGDLKFQLASNLRVGGTAYFHTTGFRSISSIFSSLQRISMLTSGRLAGVPLKMVLRPFRSNHNGQAATHHAVSLEFRAPDVKALREKLLESVFSFRELAAGEPARPTVRLIEEAAEGSPIGAAAIAAEFYPDEDGGEIDPEPVPATPAPEKLADKIRAQQKRKEAALEAGTRMAAEAAEQPGEVKGEQEDIF